MRVDEGQPPAEDAEGLACVPPARPAVIIVIAAVAALSAPGCGRPEGAPQRPEADRGPAAVRVEGPGAGTEVQICPADVAKRLKMPVYPGAGEVEGSGRMIREENRGGCSYSIRYRTEDPFPQVRDWYEKKLGRRAVSASIGGMRAAVVASRREESGAVESVTITHRNGSKSVSITLNRFEPGKGR